ncbi:MAG: DsrE family protein, partial [Nitrospirales bacterium]|nr:DsrE family protein [Nitrospirales bacterium]
MKLGIFVNTDRHPDDLAGITRAALSKGHEVVIFFMDSGTRLLRVPDIR